LIADEVFADYRLDAEDPFTDLAAQTSPCLTFTLGGFSKSLGLPQLKLGWMVVGGPAARRDAALQHLEFIADSFLSVGTPVQAAAPALLSSATSVRAAIHARVSRNLATLARHVAAVPAAALLRVEGGWSAPVRVPATRGEERLVLDLLEHQRILVYPGYFFDFPREAYVIVSLLASPAVFDAAVPRLLAAAC
jgi:aspartate/methionine/tyrosine aminotransferase